MAVYVDNVRFRYRRMVMCHMWADTQAELLALARRIGMRRDWFQAPPHASWNHYDISLTSRCRAIGFGAIETDRYGAVEYRARLAGDAATLRRIARDRARRKADRGSRRGLRLPAPLAVTRCPSPGSRY